MAIGRIRKLNVRSPYFVEVVDEYLGGVIPPDPEPDPEVPVVEAGELLCASIFHFGTIIGKVRMKVDGSDKELGTYTFEIGGIKMPVKYSIYVEGETPPAYVTMGLDTYANQWLAATGEGAGSLSTEAANPNGVTVSTTYTTAATDVSKNIIIEVYAPIETISGMTITSVSCPAVQSAPTGSGFVTVITIEAGRDIHKGSYGTAANTSDIMVNLNGTQYPMPNTNKGSGLRLILDDASPDYTVISNDTPLSGTYSSDKKWSYDEGSTGKQLIPQEVISTGVNSGTNTLVVSAEPNVNFLFLFQIAQHPVQIINGAKVIRVRFDGDDAPVSFNGFEKGFQLGMPNELSAQETLTLEFSGINTDTLVTESAFWYQEIYTSWGDSFDFNHNVLSQFGVDIVA